jgi:hypothetical protein
VLRRSYEVLAEGGDAVGSGATCGRTALRGSVIVTAQGALSTG